MEDSQSPSEAAAESVWAPPPPPSGTSPWGLKMKLFGVRNKVEHIDHIVMWKRRKTRLKNNNKEADQLNPVTFISPPFRFLFDATKKGIHVLKMQTYVCFKTSNLNYTLTYMHFSFLSKSVPSSKHMCGRTQGHALNVGKWLPCAS